MLVLTSRLSLVASLLTILALSSAPTAVYAAAIPTREAHTTTITTNAKHVPTSTHQDRPSNLGLPDGVEPSSAASRKGMGNGHWSSHSHTGTWTGTWTGTRTGGWAKPTGSTGEGAGGDEELSKRGSELAVNARGVQAPAWRRSRSSRRALAGGALKHGAGKKLRRSLSIKDGQRGGTYVVQKEKASTPAAKKAYSTYAQRRFLMRRKDIRGTPGVINIMSHVYNAEPGKKIASLYLEDNHKSGKSGYILNASEKDASEIYLVPTLSSTEGSHAVSTKHRRSEKALPSSKETLVNLRMEINQELFCATYDPNPPEAEPLTMQRCMSDDDADKDDSRSSGKGNRSADGGEKEDHKSQTFSFNPETGVIRPMWFSGEDDGRTDSDAQAHAADDSGLSSSSSALPSSTASATDAPSMSSTESPASSPTDAAAKDALDGSSAMSSSVASSTTSSSSSPSATGTVAARAASSAQNVTLVFVPSSPPAAADAVDRSKAPSDSATSSSSTEPLPTPSPTSDGDTDSKTIATTTLAVTSGLASAAAGSSGAASSSFAPTLTTTATTDAPASAAETADASSRSTTTITISASDLPSSTAGPSSGSLNVQIVGDDGKTIGDDDPFDVPRASSSSSSSGSARASPSSSMSSPTASATPTPISAAANTQSSSSTSTSAPASSRTPAVDPLAIASSVAQSWSTSRSASASASSAAAAEASSTTVSSVSSTPTSSPSPSLRTEVVAVKSRSFNSRVVRRSPSPMMTPVSTAPYKWLFKLAGI